MFINRSTFSAFLLLSSPLITHAEDAIISPSGKIIEPLVPINPDPTQVQNIEHNADPSRLIVSYASEEGKANVEKHVKAEKAKGRGVTMGKIRTYSRARRVGQTSSGGSNKNRGSGGSRGGSDKDNRGQTMMELYIKNKKKNNGGRFLQDDDGSSVGYAVIETTADFTDEEEVLLGQLPGVAFVERDVEVVVEEVRSLRGGGAERHVRDIMESMAMEQGKLPGYNPHLGFNDLGDIEEVPNNDQHHRNLAESTPYGINMVNVTDLWSIPPVLPKVNICVIDTGYDLGHADLPNNETHGVTGWDPTSGMYAEGKWYIDGHGHGTHCAGTIGAIGGNDAGVVGVNPDPTRFNFHIGKGLSDGGSGLTTDVMTAIDDCVANGAHVISMSLGSSSYQESYKNTCDEAYDAGVLIIAAAGNTASDTAHYPSGFTSVMSVASVTEGGGEGTANYGELSYFSTRNDQTEIAGPGSNVYSTYKGGGYTYMSGTSMATPHVAGVAALLISHFPTCTNNQIRNAMIHTASEPPTGDTRNSPGWDKYYGWGIVNAGRAYELLSTGCDAAGGIAAPLNEGDTLSDLALGGQDQKQIGCISDDQCSDANTCLGIQLCNVTTNTCYAQEGTVPNCDDGFKCTIDTCNPSLFDGTDLQSMCVNTQKVCDDDNLCNGQYSCRNDTGTCELDVPVVDCDDGDACTINECVPSTGLCTTKDKNCDDGNPCTLGDTCDSTTGCVISDPIENCCGNFVCEAGISENLETCPQDCSTSISTPMVKADSPDGTSIPFYGYAGTLLNLQTKEVPMSITGFGIHCTLPEGEAGTLYVYTKEGNHYDDGAWHSPFMWNRVMRRTNFTCAGEGEKTYIYFQEAEHDGEGWHSGGAIKIPAQSMHAIHIFVDHEDLDSVYPTMTTIRFNTCDGGGPMHMYHEDNFIAIHAGSGNRAKSQWNSIVSPQVFSGEVLYAVTEDEGEPPAATDTPTGAPTTSIAPTGTTFALTTPEEGSSYASAYGYMFDTVSKTSEDIRILSFSLFFKVDQCQYKLWSRLGDTHYEPDAWGHISNEPKYWDLIGEGNITRTGGWGGRTSLKYGDDFAPQIIPPGGKRAFYIAFFGCSASWPLAVDRGDNYLTGVAAEDDHLAIMEGIKKSQISTTEPISYKNFGANYPSCCTPGAGNSMSHTMRGSSITYDFPGGTVPDAPVATTTLATTTTGATTTTEAATTTTEATTTTTTTTQEAEPTSTSPTASPSKPPTNVPTEAPTTAAPTHSPTLKPTVAPTENPTASPSLSIAPTKYEPEVVDLLNTMANSCSIVRGLYFDVTAGDKWAKITDLKISTYSTRHIEVYAKKGPASGSLKTPCAWELVGETSPTWYSSWERDVSPPWVNGFKSQILAPGQTVAFYLHAKSPTYGLCMKRGSYKGPMWQPFKTLPAESPVGAVSISWGRTGYLDEAFKPGSSTYPYVIYGGVELETLQPGTESSSPTMAPTSSTTPGSIERTDVSLSEISNGLQFDIENLGANDIIVNKIGIPLDGSGSKLIDVWYRDGSHEGSSSGCQYWNNDCNQWKKLVDSNTVYALGSSSLTYTPGFVAIAKAGAITSFVIASPEPIVLAASNVASDTHVVANADLAIKPATPLVDYYGSYVQSSHALPDPASKLFNVNIDYDIAHSLCAVQEKASWTTSLAAASMSLGTDGVEDESDELGEIDEVVTFPDPDPILGGGGLVDGDGPPMEELLE